MFALVLLALGVSTPSPTTVLTLDDVLARALPAPAEMELETSLAEAARLLAVSGGLLREGPTLSFGVGPRRDAEGRTRSDAGIAAEVPLVLSRRTASAFSAALAEAAPLERAAARGEALLAVRRAFLDAWLDERVLSLRELDVTTVETWLSAAYARRDAGADAPFQAILVEGELLRSRNELAETRAHRAEAWGRLRALAEVPAMPVTLADPTLDAKLDDVERTPLPAAALLRRAVLARAELDFAVADRREALANARWSLRADARREAREEVVTLGFAVGLPRAGEPRAIARESEAAKAGARRRRNAALAALEGRANAARERVRQATTPPPAPDVESALRAVALRLSEGKERPSEALPIRRQLLETRIASLRQEHALRVAAAELSTLLEEAAR